MFSAIRGNKFLLTCYNPIAEILEMLVLINSAISKTFKIYKKGGIKTRKFSN